jgi:hypothetical protein
MYSEPRFEACGNLSIAWANAICRVLDRGVAALTPLVVSVTDFDDDQLPREHAAIREALDRSLRVHGSGLSVETVAGTIFPNSLWHPGVNREVLFRRYRNMIPRLKRDSRNRNGLYFERLVAYPEAPAAGNQLEYILQCYRGGIRRKPALQAGLLNPAVDFPVQAAVFNPAHDLTMQPQRGFPCMQQIAFAPDSEHKTVSMSAFYASQYLYKRAYGNYLGLCRLGRFMASEMDLKLARVTCYVGFAQLDDTPGKIKLRRLERKLQTLLASIPTAVA